MISKHISCDPRYDSYRKLAHYIADNQQDKVAAIWCVGCADNEDFETSISEIMATQALNRRSKKEKTYHIMVSFRPEDKDKLTVEILKEIESRFAEVLGLSEHQRHCAFHVNTDNPHIHIAYNLIHPDKLRRNEPYRAYNKMAKLRRELEKKYGLEADSNNDHRKTKDISDKATTMEAFSGKQSFEGYCKERKEQIVGAVGSALDWQAVHEIFAQYGIAIKPHGNGLVLQAQGKKKNNIKASSLDRSLSKGKLEARLGPFQEAKLALPQAHEIYEAKPLGNASELTEYQQAKTERQKALAEIKAPFLEKLDKSKGKWKQKRQDYQMMALTKKDRADLVRKTYELERKERREIYADMRMATKSAYNQLNSKTWPEYRRKVVTERQELEHGRQKQSLKTEEIQRASMLNNITEGQGINR